jgi:hypothetical protein
MVLQFENAGTCLIVKQYLDRARNIIRRELMDKFCSSFASEATMSSPQVDCHPQPISPDVTQKDKP